MKNYKMALLVLLCLTLVFTACTNGSFDVVRNGGGSGEGGNGGNGGGNEGGGGEEEEVDPNLAFALCFTAGENNIDVGLFPKEDAQLPDPVPVLQYSTDGENWNNYIIGESIRLPNSGDKVYFQGNNESFNQADAWLTFQSDGPVEAGGNIMSLLDTSLQARTIPNEYCFRNLFAGCTSLTTPPALPATTLAEGCYAFMFYGCENLTKAPKLPATTLADYCYRGMFNSCINLTEAPALPAPVVPNYGYYQMFIRCTNLETAPETLPALTLGKEAYSNMFFGCGSLTAAPELPATNLSESCYQAMFVGCAALTQAPELPATTLPTRCYYYMFQNCSQLRSIKVNFSDWNETGLATKDWMVNVSASGSFTCPDNLDWDTTRDSSHFPEGWTRATN